MRTRERQEGMLSTLINTHIHTHRHTHIHTHMHMHTHDQCAKISKSLDTTFTPETKPDL